MNSPRLLRRYQILRTAAILALIILSLPSVTTFSARGQSYNLKYDLGYVGIPFTGGAISIVSNFTNIGQLTVRVTGVSFASDFWSNGTRQLSTGLPFNLTAGLKKEVDTPVLIPTTTLVGNHNLTSTATWQYVNSSGWYNAPSVVVNKIVPVSQTISSLFASLATTLLIGLGVAVIVVVLAAFLVIRRRRKSKPSPPLPTNPQVSLKT